MIIKWIIVFLLLCNVAIGQDTVINDVVMTDVTVRPDYVDYCEDANNILCIRGTEDIDYAIDESDSHNHGVTVLRATVTAAGKEGKGWEFPGNDGATSCYFQLENIIYFDENYTLCFWFNADDVTDRKLAGYNTSDNVMGWFQTNTVIRLVDDAFTNLEFTVPAMSINTWYWLCITKDGSSNWRLYLNNVESSTGAITDGDRIQLRRFGDGYNTGWGAFNGQQDEWAVWTRVLTAAERADIYANGLR